MASTTPSNNDASVINAVKRWLDQFIIELNLCPFANRERVNDRIRFCVSTAGRDDRLIDSLIDELCYLDAHPEVETTLLIHPGTLTRFDDYNQFLNDVDVLLESLNLDGIYQVASFHPDYQFAGTAPDDAENYTNRSPYPMLHILREASVASAIEHHPNADGIPDANITTLNRMGGDSIRDLLRSINPDV